MRVRKAMDKYGFDSQQARAFLKAGNFRGVDVEATERFNDMYYMKGQGRDITFVRREDGHEVSPMRATGILHQGFYNAMVRRLEIWTDKDRDEVRNYLSRFENWRDGISPMYRENEA
jgi:hypothetical protein